LVLESGPRVAALFLQARFGLKSQLTDVIIAAAPMQAIAERPTSAYTALLLAG
jgi:hypothetical protein